MDTALRGEGSKGEGLRWRDLGLVVAGTLATLELSRTLWNSASSDVGGYYRTALAFWAGRPPLRALPVEYPPGAVAPFALTLLPLGDPVLAFLVGASVAFTLGYLLFVRVSGRRAANRYALYALLGAQGTLLDRYDLFPALLTLGALWLTQRNRFLPAYALLAGGVALKLYPALLIPAVAIAQWRALSGSSGSEALARRVWRVAGGMALCAAVIALTTLAPMALSSNGFSALRYSADRPVQVESLQATFVWLGALVGVPVRVVETFGSQGFVGPLAQVTPAPAMVALVLACAWVYLRQARGEIAVGWSFLTLICVLVLTSKVFSAQYLVWLLPIAAETGGYESLWIVVAVLTTLDYPLLFPYSDGVPQLAEVWLYMLVVALRNAALLGITALLLVGRDLSITTKRERIAGDDVEARRGGDVL